MTGLSLCMVVCDEQDRLPRCLASVAGLVDEIVVVDTGSTDATVDVARVHGARVIAHDFTRVDFALARNCGLDAARGRFALILDADEILHPGSAPLVRQLMAKDGEAGWIVARRNIPDGAAEPAWVDHAVRLFPNHPRYRFRRRIHETVDDAILDAGGRLLRSSVVLDHHLTPAEDLRGKWRRYVDLVREDLADHPDDVDRLVFLMADYYKLGEYDLATATARRIAGLRPDDTDAQLDAALCTFAHTGDLTAARGYLAAAVAISPDDPRVRQMVEDLDPTVSFRGAG